MKAVIEGKAISRKAMEATVVLIPKESHPATMRWISTTQHV